MADYWDQYQPYLTADQALSLNDRQLSGRTSTTTPTAGAGPMLPGNTMGFSPEQEAAIRNWSATGGGTQQTSGTGDKAAVLKFIADWQASQPATPQSFQQLANELQTRFGVQRAPGAVGPSNNEFDIFGEKVKVMAGEDSGRPSWFAYGADDGWRPGGESATGMPGGYSTTGVNNLASFSAPGLAAPWTQEFRARSPEEIKNDPAYQFQLQQGEEALLRNRAATGNIYTGGTLKDMNAYAQGLASTYNDKYYGRDIGEYQMNRDTFWNNQNNAFNKLSDFAQMGQNAATQTGNFGSGYANNVQTGATNLGNLATGQANANAGAAIQRGNVNTDLTAGVTGALGEIDWSKLFKTKPYIEDRF